MDVKLPELVDELRLAFLEIQQPRSNYALEHFVVGDNFGSKTREYAQIVEELRRAHSSIRRGLLERQKLQIERDALLQMKSAVGDIDAQIKSLDIEEIDYALTGKLREFDCLFSLWKAYKKYTRTELETGEAEYWATNLQTQAARDLIARNLGISVASQHGMERAGLTPRPVLHDMIGPAAGQPAIGTKGTQTCMR